MKTIAYNKQARTKDIDLSSDQTPDEILHLFDVAFASHYIEPQIPQKTHHFQLALKCPEVLYTSAYDLLVNAS